MYMYLKLNLKKKQILYGYGKNKSEKNAKKIFKQRMVKRTQQFR